MRRRVVLSLLLLGASPVLAQEVPATDRHQVAAGNNWSISDSQCLLDAGWDGDVTIMVNRHNDHYDHYDLGLYDKGLKGVVDEKVVRVRFGAGDTNVAGRDYTALGHQNADGTSYVADVDAALLDRIAAANTFQFYRGKTLLADLDMTGFSQALGVMRACEARAPRPADESLDGSRDTSAAAADIAM